MGAETTIEPGKRKLTLPAGLDINAAAAIAETLIKCRGEDVVIDATFVKWLGYHALQILRTAFATWRLDGRLLVLANGPASLIEDLRYFGVEPEWNWSRVEMAARAEFS